MTQIYEKLTLFLWAGSNRRQAHNSAPESSRQNRKLSRHFRWWKDEINLQSEWEKEIRKERKAINKRPRPSKRANIETTEKMCEQIRQDWSESLPLKGSVFVFFLLLSALARLFGIFIASIRLSSASAPPGSSRKDRKKGHKIKSSINKQSTVLRCSSGWEDNMFVCMSKSAKKTYKDGFKMFENHVF